MTRETTPEKHGGAPPWKPGQSGNPAGRPKGSRNKLGEEFIRALYDDFTAHGVDVIRAVREEKPDAYLKIVASLMPVEISGEVVHFVARIPEAAATAIDWKQQHAPAPLIEGRAVANGASGARGK